MAGRRVTSTEQQAVEAAGGESESDVAYIDHCPNKRCRRQRICLAAAKGEECPAMRAWVRALHAALLAMAMEEVKVEMDRGYTHPSQVPPSKRHLRSPDDGGNATREELRERIRRQAWHKLDQEAKAKRAGEP